MEILANAGCRIRDKKRNLLFSSLTSEPSTTSSTLSVGNISIYAFPSVKMDIGLNTTFIESSLPILLDTSSKVRLYLYSLNVSIVNLIYHSDVGISVSYICEKDLYHLGVFSKSSSVLDISGSSRNRSFIVM